MQPAGTAIQGFGYFYDEATVRQGAKAKAGDSGTIDGSDRRIDRRGKMHGSRVIGIIHDRAAHQGRGLQKRQAAAEVGDGGGGGYSCADLFAKCMIQGSAQ